MRFGRLIFLILILAACKTASVTTSKKEYSEDLSVFRPELVVEESKEDEPESEEKRDLSITPPKSAINYEIDSINTLIIEENRKKEYYDGYTIQIYRGNSREEAEHARAKARVIFPEMRPSLSYYQPTYRVKMGRFFSRLEATKAFSEVKAEFRNAILLPDQIKLPISDEDDK